jgi:toxin-antitoxin system PIN domain toxin
MRALLDVNVLIALLDSDHLHHGRARGWLKENIKHGWASCPLTQNGCIRIMSQTGYPNALPAAAVAERLAAAIATNHHVFWPDTVSLLDAGRVTWNAVLGSRQVTDVYLLALAVAQRGRFVTLDRAVSLKAVTGAKAGHLVVI